MLSFSSSDNAKQVELTHQVYLFFSVNEFTKGVLKLSLFIGAPLAALIVFIIALIGVVFITYG